MLVLLLACSEFPVGNPGPTPPQPTHPTVAKGGCGQPESPWLGFADVGDVVAFEPVPALSLSLETLQFTLALADFPEELLDVRYGVQTYRVRYTTQDRGEAVEATMLVSFPLGAGEVPTLAWLHPTVGFNDSCAPSAGGIEEGAFNLLFASTGMFVVGPDYLGMAGFGAPSGQLHPYIVGEATAVASLDALRAAWRFQGQVDHGTSGTRRTVLMGASEGGFASLWTDRYQPHYLPEADVVGVVAAVPPADLLGITREAVRNPIAATAGLAATLTTWHAWYEMESPLDTMLQPDLADVLPGALATDCSPSGVVGERDTVEAFFTQPFIDAALQDDELVFPELACAVRQNTLLTSQIPYAGGVPVLYVVSEQDDLVVAGPTRAAFLPLCEAGYTMEYLECAGANHAEGAVWSLQQQLAWVEDRLAGLELSDPCILHPASTCTLEGAF